jgi:dephospho-CoA kinase
MLLIGLTGGIGAGKSAVSTRLAELGAIVIDADALSREVVRAGTEGLAEVVAEFGPDVLTPAGELDRAALGRLVFADADRRTALERIIHPRVRARSAQIVTAAPADAVIVNDVPLLVETGQASAYQLVIVVLAAEAVRIARLVRDRGMSEQDARDRIAAQATDDQRRAVADIVIVNDGTLDDLRAAVDAAWQNTILPRLKAGKDQH